MVACSLHFRLAMHPVPLVTLLILTAISASVSQEAVTVGKGSHAATAPTGVMMDAKRGVDLVAETEGRKLFLVEDDGRPVPSNKWYQNLLFQQYGTGLWAMPHRVDATREGVEIFHATGFSGDGVRAIAEWPLVVTGRDFSPKDSRAKAWSDWSVSFRCFESESRFMDVTLGEGMPAVWCEFKGVRPLLAFGDRQGKGSRAKNGAAYFGMDGKPLSLPVTGDALGLTHEGRHWSVFAPDGSRFVATEAGIAVDLSGTAAFLVVVPLSKPQDLAFFHRHAFAVPRDTRLSWSYDRAAGRITTTWKIVTEPLRAGAAASVVQGFLPHHWRENLAPLPLDGPVYHTIRGPMKCGIGNEFTIAYPFHGILPNYPAPQKIDTERVRSQLAAHFIDRGKPLRGDTYWGGKELQKQAQAAFIATQTKDPGAEAAVERLRTGLENWLTFTPGEKGQYFGWYPRRKGLVGFPAAYGSEHFTDTHFHQGYFVFAAAVLCQLQPDFAAGYGGMARLIAKNYANDSREDVRFPRFRTFDIWRGHSFADGNGFPEGNNQESTGEAVNSWAAMILLGEALGDPDLTAAGVMGYAFETRANVEYWFDPHGDVFPIDYAHDACGMIWTDRIVWGTWFTASPAWIYGIQWLPTAPHAAFYDQDRDFITRIHSGWQREQLAFEQREAANKPGSSPNPADIKSLGGELGSYHLGFLMHGDAPQAVAEIEKLWAELGDKTAHSEWMLNVWWQASALKELGRVDWSCHGNNPTSMVYVNAAAKTRTFLAWNPSAATQSVEFFRKGKRIFTLQVPPHGIAQKSAGK